MKVYGCNEFSGHWPVGTAAVVTARSAHEACDILNAQLRDKGLPGDAKVEDMKQIHTGKNKRTVCWIMRDGDY